MSTDKTEILVVGGGLGGVAAALAALRLGRKVILSEETDWVGGQLTAQAVPPDEHPWIESTGCTASYRRLREEIRSYYRRNYPLLPQLRQNYAFDYENMRYGMVLFTWGLFKKVVLADRLGLYVDTVYD